MRGCGLPSLNSQLWQTTSIFASAVEVHKQFDRTRPHNGIIASIHQLNNWHGQRRLDCAPAASAGFDPLLKG